MTGELALHTAARRYCEERAAHWRSRYAELGSHIDHAGYTVEERDVFPRYNALEAVLVEVERLMLSLAGQIAESMFTKPPNGPVENERCSRNVTSSALM